MSGLDHDLVVPTDSALSFGAPQGVLKCSHIRYFADNQAQSAIQNFVRPASAPVVATPAPVATGQIRKVDDTLWIGNVRIPVRQP